MSIFWHIYSAFANELATTCYSMSPVHKYCTNIAQILQDCTNEQHSTTEQHGTHWATREQLSNKQEVRKTHGSPGHGICVHMILGIYLGHQWHKGWPFSPCVMSGALNIIQIYPFWDISKTDINTKRSWYLSQVKKHHPRLQEYLLVCICSKQLRKMNFLFKTQKIIQY